MIEQITDMQFRRICRFLKENRELMSRLLNVKVNLSSLDLMRNDCSSHFIRMMVNMRSGMSGYSLRLLKQLQQSTAPVWEWLWTD